MHVEMLDTCLTIGAERLQLDITYLHNLDTSACLTIQWLTKSISTGE